MIEVCINGCPLILEDGDAVYMGIEPPKVLGDFSPVTLFREGEIVFQSEWMVFEGAEDIVERWLEHRGTPLDMTRVPIKQHQYRWGLPSAERQPAP